MITQGKVWGKTSPVFHKNNIEVHRIECKAGTFCSEHHHKHKFNLFFVEEGDIDIVEWNNSQSISNIKTSQMYTVEPAVLHQFRAVEDSVVYELYWAEFNVFCDHHKFVDFSSISLSDTNSLCLFKKDDVKVYRSLYYEGEVRSNFYRHRNSMFFVENGEVEISVHKKDYNLVDKTFLTPMNSTIVKPEERYEIKATKDAVLYEFYWVELCPSDIVRKSVGGCVGKA